MLIYYYSKGSSALAAHILLEEIGEEYEAVEIPIAAGAHRTDAFLKLNPKGRIPVLVTQNGVISENPAILEHLAAVFPHRRLLPEGHFDLARLRSLLAYLCATAHVAFAHGRRGSRWARTPEALADMQSKVAENLTECARFLEADLALAPWAMGENYFCCDPYVFQFCQWLETAKVSIAAFPRLSAHKKAMHTRPATQAVLKVHDLI